MNTLVTPKDWILTVEVLNSHSVVERNVVGIVVVVVAAYTAVRPRGIDYVSSFHQFLHAHARWTHSRDILSRPNRRRKNRFAVLQYVWGCHVPEHLNTSTPVESSSQPWPASKAVSGSNFPSRYNYMRTNLL